MKKSRRGFCAMRRLLAKYELGRTQKLGLYGEPVGEGAAELEPYVSRAETSMSLSE